MPIPKKQPEFNPERDAKQVKALRRQTKIARILADAAKNGDEKAAKDNKCSVRAIQLWRKELSSDPILAKKYQVALQDWSIKLAPAIVKAIEYCESSLAQLDKTKPENLKAVVSVAQVLMDTANFQKAVSRRLGLEEFHEEKVELPEEEEMEEEESSSDDLELFTD